MIRKSGYRFSEKIMPNKKIERDDDSKKSHPALVRVAAQGQKANMSVPHIPGMTDEELMVYAMREAQMVLAQHIERSPQDAEETIALLLEILDRQDVVNATDRLCRGYGLRPIR